MEQKEIIYILFSCNIWKEYSSMRLIAASTNILSIYNIVQEEISNKNMEYGDLIGCKALKLFEQDLKKGFVDFNKLGYGTVMEEENV